LKPTPDLHQQQKALLQGDRNTSQKRDGTAAVWCLTHSRRTSRWRTAL